jgi:hypothetical protein
MMLQHVATIDLRRHSGAMRQHRTRNLEIPGLVLAHHPGMTAVPEGMLFRIML